MRKAANFSLSLPTGQAGSNNRLNGVIFTPLFRRYPNDMRTDDRERHTKALVSHV